MECPDRDRFFESSVTGGAIGLGGMLGAEFGGVIWA
jgi:hypothetical protein